VEEVLAFLNARVASLRECGVAPQKILIDPGFGFGKTLEHNYSLLKHLDELKVLGLPILAGMSRKSMIGGVLDKPVEERLVGSVAAALLALERGATVLRVHDVAPTMDAVRIWSAMQAAD
jgi:dihydropteroate synthase